MARDVSRKKWHLTVFLLTPCLLLALGERTNAQNIFPEIQSLSVTNITNEPHAKKVEFEVRGRNFFSGMQLKATKTAADRDSICEDLTDYGISEISIQETFARYVITLPESERANLYFCLPHVVGKDDGFYESSLIGGEKMYHQGNVHIPDAANLVILGSSQSNIHVSGIRLEASSAWELDEYGVPSVLSFKKATLRLFGSGFSNEMLVTFTSKLGEPNDICEFPIPNVFRVKNGTLKGATVNVEVELPELDGGEAFYLCVKDRNTSGSFRHQGVESWRSIRTHKSLVPVWAAIIIIIFCLAFSALFSGLNLGLMSLDRTELKILCNTGTAKEKKYAKIIQPVRNTGNYLLCSILLGNVLVNSTFTILLDGLTSGLIAVIFSTIAIVLFGEISPQAVCSKHGLAIGAKTIYITKFVMFLTFPLSYPVSKMLDFLLGEEIGAVYTRERLKELVRVTTGENDLDKDEVNIISGALELRKKTVADVMTRIEDAFMLEYDAILDFETVSEIMKSGYSRIPVYESDRKKIVTTLYIKDLAFVDPDDNTPLKTLCQFYQNPCNFVFEDVTLDVMFKEFKDGNKGHMAFVHRVNSEGEGDPFYETVGLITLEDVIEELIQAEIMDETDVFTDNRSRRKRTANRSKQDFTVFAERRGESNRIRISPQLTLATFQYLSTSVDLFKPNNISETILRRLLKQDIIYHIRKNKDWRNDPTTVIYQQNKAVDYFVLVLEGRIEVTIGQEGLVFESGPFTYFGTQALTQNIGIVDTPTTMGSLQSLNMDTMIRYTFLPDYTVRACSEVLYLRVKRSLYLAAKKATLMERSQRDMSTPGDFDEEVEKLLHSLGEEDSIGRSTPEPKPPVSIIAATKGSHNEHLPTSNLTSPKLQTPTSTVSPTSGNYLNARVRDINGALKKHSDGMIPEEEVKLLSSRKS